MTEIIPKPVSEVWRPELTRLPKLTRARRAFRVFGHGLMKLVAKVCLNVSCEGLEHFGNPELFLRSVYNHLKTDGTLLITTPTSGIRRRIAVSGR